MADVMQECGEANQSRVFSEMRPIDRSKCLSNIPASAERLGCEQSSV